MIFSFEISCMEITFVQLRIEFIFFSLFFHLIFRRTLLVNHFWFLAPWHTLSSPHKGQDSCSLCRSQMQFQQALPLSNPPGDPRATPLQTAPLATRARAGAPLCWLPAAQLSCGGSAAGLCGAVRDSQVHETSAVLVHRRQRG